MIYKGYILLLQMIYYYIVDLSDLLHRSVLCFLKGFIIKLYSLAILLISVWLMPAQVSAIEVVTNLQVPEVSLTQAQLRRIYTMRQLRWSDDSVITVFVLPNQHSLHHRFAKERLQIFPYQLNRIWHKLTYSGLGVAPTIVESEQELIQAVMNTPGSIGYIHDQTLLEITKGIKTSEGNETQQVSSKGVVNVVKIQD